MLKQDQNPKSKSTIEISTRHGCKNALKIPQIALNVSTELEKKYSVHVLLVCMCFHSLTYKWEVYGGSLKCYLFFLYMGVSGCVGG